MKMLPICLSFFLMTSGAAQQPRQAPVSTTLPSAPVEVPLRLAGRQPLVEVKVNGTGPYTFLLDTGGAGLARADTSLVESLKLEVVGEARGAVGPGAPAVAMPIVRYATLQIGGATFANVEAPSRDYNAAGRGAKISGILGFGLFKDCLLTLDFPRGILRLERGALPEPDGKEVLPFTNPRGIPELPVQIAGVEMQAHLDSGAMGGITVPQSLADKLPLASPPAVIGKAMTVSGPMELSAAPLQGSVRLGRHEFANPIVTFAPPIRQMNLGIDVLSEFVVTVDQQNGRIRFARTGDGPISLKPR